MRQIKQPGPAHAEPIQWVEARGERFAFEIEAGQPLIEAVRRGFAARGYESGVLNATGGALAPFAYVMPALSETADHAAFYSAVFKPAGLSWMSTAAMTFGSRDGEPFFHCHALWREADGRLNGGHILPEGTEVAESFRVEAIGLDGAGFAAEPDAETGFKLFGPVARPSRGSAAEARVFALRLRPNRDMAGLLEQFCRDRGIGRARIHGGVGSIIGARFDDGRTVEPFATEMAVRAGLVAPGAGGALEASLDVVLVDYAGGLAEGRLKRGDNPVLMTVELVLEAF